MCIRQAHAHKSIKTQTCVLVSTYKCVHMKVYAFFVCTCVGGNGLICLCILTMFIRAAAAALMRNTFGLILLPHVVETGGGLLEYKQCLFSILMDTH